VKPPARMAETHGKDAAAGRYAARDPEIPERPTGGEPPPIGEGRGMKKAPRRDTTQNWNGPCKSPFPPRSPRARTAGRRGKGASIRSWDNLQLDSLYDKNAPLSTQPGDSARSIRNGPRTQAENALTRAGEGQNRPPRAAPGRMLGIKHLTNDVCPVSKPRIDQNRFRSPARYIKEANAPNAASESVFAHLLIQPQNVRVVW
jgi:hypothetical protein